MSKRINAKPLVITPKLSAVEVSQLFLEHNVEAAPVINEQDEVVGFITRNHLLKLIARGLNLHTLAEEVMSPIAEPDESLPGLPELYDGNLPMSMLQPAEIKADYQLTWLSYELLYKKYCELTACIDSMHNPVIAIDDQGNVNIFNKAAQQLLSVTFQDAYGRNIKDVDVSGTSKLIDVLKTGESQSTQKFRTGGKTFLSNRTPIITNGKVVGAVAVLQEISELEKIVDELTFTKRLNSQLDAIFESSFDGLYLTDGQGNTLRLNQGFERITGVAASECIGRNMTDLVKEGIYSRSGTLLALEKRQRVTITLQTNVGKTALVTSTPIFDEAGNIIFVATNARDITELNDLQKKLEQIEGLSHFYRAELQQLKLQASKQLVVHSNKMKELVNMVMRVAAVDSTVLIQGESGVGKELIVDMLHANSKRKNGPLIKINCGAIPENLLESELFGYEPGAFTGANKNGKAGLFELAGGGILFLDEIGDMPLSLQVKLLRALQNMEITRVGGIRPVKIDLRILTGTNRNLPEMVANRQFRQDLYYRLNVVPIHVPPLRDRREDIPVLSNYFLEVFNRKYQMNKRLAAGVIGCFMDYDWPGNVRELENFIERLVVTNSEDKITPEDLPAWLKQKRKLNNENKIIPLRYAIEKTERQALERAFSVYKSTYEIAEALGINQSTVVRKAAKYGIKKK